MIGSMKRFEAPPGVEFAEISDTLDLRVPDKGHVDEVVRVTLGEGYKQLRVNVGASSRMRLAVYFGADDLHSEDMSVKVEVTLEPLACLDIFYILPGASPLDKLVSGSEYHLKKHASLNVWTLASDALATIRQSVLFEDEHAFASLRGLSILSHASDIQHHIHARHDKGHCISRQLYKSIVTDEAKTSFQSLVSVAKGANKSDSKQLNKNLVLSRKAKATSKPELEIQADDVACAHGSATGELSADELFYLRSRGISEKTARVMMVEGFASEILDEVPEIAFKDELKAWVLDHVKAVGGV